MKEKLDRKRILAEIKVLKKRLDALNEVKFSMWPYYNKYDKYRKLYPLELMEYMLLRKFDTKLPVDIFVDDGGAYIRHGHSLWLYFKNNYDDNPKNVLPLTISNNPVIPLGKYKLEISQSDYNEIVQFVKDNVKIISDLANSKIRQREFFDALTDYKLKNRKPLNELEMRETIVKTIMIKELKNIIWAYYFDYDEYRKLDDMELMEYMLLHKFTTRLSVDIYIDDGGAYIRHKHPLWLYFENNYEGDSRNLLPLTLSKNPVIPLGEYNLNISRNDFNEIVHFIKSNLKILVDFGNDKIERQEVFRALKNYTSRTVGALNGRKNNKN